VARSDGYLVVDIDSTIKWCWSRIKFDCCQGEVLLSRFGPLPEIGKCVSLVDTSRWLRNVGEKVEKRLGRRKGKYVVVLYVCDNGARVCAGGCARKD
jgi:hypothetical protein